jgi:hypothetical protein
MLASTTLKNTKMVLLSTGQQHIRAAEIKFPCFTALAFRRHVTLPKEMVKTLPKARLLNEDEWRGIGVQQSRGWVHYAIHRY